ncbi:MAG: hypothetical protein D6772_17015 [Bacteroidetes bacterium]|nr:MAG: hypothetical protein D6772_17015 [Bacteroidota bacterium]
MPALWGQVTYQQFISQDQFFQAYQLAETRLQTHPQDSAALFFRGYSLLKLGEPEAAYASLLAAEAAGFNAPHLLRLAQSMSLAQLGKKEHALALLDSLTHSGFANLSALQDPLLAPLKAYPTYQTAVDSARTRSFPCLSSPAHRHFDFWIGEWEVFVGPTKVGDNSITRQAGGCSILEQYTTTRDYIGHSLNFYDPYDDKWKQIWIDKTQSISKYVESERRPGYLQFVTTPESTPAHRRLRMTFELQHNGEVTQFIEQWNTKEEDWQAVFNGIYRRKK